MKEYVLHLVKDKRKRSFVVLAWLLAVSNLIFVTYIAIATAMIPTLRWIIFPSVAYLLFLALFQQIKGKTFLNQYSLLPLFLLLAIGWFLLNFVLMGIASLLICVTAFFALSDKSILFTQNHVRPRVLFGQRIEWSTLSNVILKDNVLTIDYKNNKLLQQEIDDSISLINEQEFNDFCRLQLGK
jgi:hypothetical protein